MGEVIEDQLTKSHDALLKVANRLLSEAVPAEVIAGVLVALGMGLYRTIFDDDEFEAMMEEIYKRRKEVYVTEN
jgi:hypothetical protein